MLALPDSKKDKKSFIDRFGSKIGQTDPGTDELGSSIPCPLMDIKLICILSTGALFSPAKPQVHLPVSQLSPRFTFLFRPKPQVHLLIFGQAPGSPSCFLLSPNLTSLFRPKPQPYLPVSS